MGMRTGGCLGKVACIALGMGGLATHEYGGQDCIVLGRGLVFFLINGNRMCFMLLLLFRPLCLVLIT